MSVDVDLEIKPQSGVETTDRLSLIRFLESLGLQERESDVFYSRGGEEDVAVELSCSEHKVLGVSVGADGALWESATRLALAIAGHLGWKVFDNVRGDFIPHWELDAPVGLRPAMECVRSGLQRESVGWLLRRFAIHLVPTDLLWLSLLLLCAAVSSKAANWLLSPLTPIWAGTGVVVGITVALGVLTANATLSVLGEVRTREISRRYGDKG